MAALIDVPDQSSELANFPGRRLIFSDIPGRGGSRVASPERHASQLGAAGATRISLFSLSKLLIAENDY